MKVSMLTTTDNPFSPFDDYKAWFAYDVRLGYNSPCLLAETVLTSEELSEQDQELAIERAIDEIVSENFSGVHIKVSKEVDTSTDFLSVVNDLK